MSTQIRGNKQIKNITIENEQLVNGTIELNKLKEGAELIKRDGSVPFTGDIDVGSHKIVNLAEPVNANDAVRKADLDAVAEQIGGTLITREVVSGTKDGENVTFTLAQEPTLATEQIFFNGALLNAGVAADYTISGNVITFAVAPQAGDSILANYVVDAIQLNVDVQATLNQINGRVGLVEADMASAEADIAALESADTAMDVRVTAAEADIASLETRATNLETNVDAVEADIAAEESRAMAAESALDVRVSSSEVEILGLKTRMTATEGDIDDLEAADVAMDSRVGNLEDGLQAETTARTNAVSSLNTRVTALENADTDVDSRLDVLESDVSVLQADLTSEAATRLANDNTLQSNINAEIANRTSAVSAVQSNLNIEIADRVADVDAEESRAMAAEGTIATNLSNAITAASAEDATLLKLDGSRTMTGPIVVDTTGVTTASINSTSPDNMNLMLLGHSSSAAAVGLNLLNNNLTRAYFAHFGGVNWAEIASNDGTVSHSSIRISTASSTLGRIALNSSNFDSQLRVDNGSASSIGLTVRAANGQTADLQRWLASDGSFYASVSAAGAFYLFKSAIVTPPNATSTALRAKGVAGQSVPIFDVINSSNVRMFSVSSTGAINNAVAANALGNLTVTSAAAATNGMVVKGAVSQSANLLEIQNSSGTALFSIDKDGSMAAGAVPVARVTGLHAVATSGSYNDLADKPSIPSIAGLATETYVDTAVAAVVNSAPAVLDTLNELAAALNDDPNFATTMTTALAAKADSSSLADVATSGSYVDLSNKPTIYTPVKEVFTSLVDGTETEFVLADAPAVAGTEQVFVNGILQSAGASDDYTISGDTITFNTAPEAGWKLIVYYSV